MHKLVQMMIVVVLMPHNIYMAGMHVPCQLTLTECEICWPSHARESGLRGHQPTSPPSSWAGVHKHNTKHYSPPPSPCSCCFGRFQQYSCHPRGTSQTPKSGSRRVRKDVVLKRSLEPSLALHPTQTSGFLQPKPITRLKT